VSCSPYSSTLKMKAICSSETSTFTRYPWCYVPQDGTLGCNEPLYSTRRIEFTDQINSDHFLKMDSTVWS
jgi:hypothetical protein